MSFEGQFDPDNVNENIVDDYHIPLLAMPDRDSVELGQRLTSFASTRFECQNFWADQPA